MISDNLQILSIIEVMERFLERVRPPENVRPQLDIGYKIEGQTILIHEIRPFWNDSLKIIYPEVAKATFVKSKNHWKVSWLKGNLEWCSHEPKPIVKTLKDFANLVEEDKHACFWG